MRATAAKIARRVAPRRHGRWRRYAPLVVMLCLAFGFVLGVFIFGMLRDPTPSAFDRPEAQIPNKLRSPWGGQSAY